MHFHRPDQFGNDALIFSVNTNLGEKLKNAKRVSIVSHKETVKGNKSNIKV